MSRETDVTTRPQVLIDLALQRRSTDRFLAAHADDLGKQSTTDLDVLLQEC